MFSLTSRRVLIEFLVRSPQSPLIRAPESCVLPGQGRSGARRTLERKALGPASHRPAWRDAHVADWRFGTRAPPLNRERPVETVGPPGPVAFPRGR